MYRSARKVDEWLESIGYCSAWSFAAVFLLTFFEVIVRYVFHSPTIWTLEVTLMCIGIGYTFTGIYPVTRRTHIRIDIFYQRFPRMMRNAVDVIIEISGVVFFIFIVMGAYVQASASYSQLERSGSAWNSFQPLINKITIFCASTVLLLACLRSFSSRICEMWRSKQGAQTHA